MSKQEILEKLASDLRSCADSISAFAQLLSADTDGAITLVPMDQPTDFDVHLISSEQTAAPTVTLAEIRSCLAELSRVGLTDKVSELIHSHGAEKLSDVPESEYAALLAEAEVLKNGQ